MQTTDLRSRASLLVFLLALAGCPSRTPPGDAQPDKARAPEPTEAPAAAPVDPAPTGTEGATDGPSPAAAECIEECMHASMAQARSPEAIRADCEASCGTGAAAPVTNGGELALMVGKRIKVTGTLVRADYPTMDTSGAAIELADGARVWVDEDGVPDGWDRFEGQTVAVVGTLTQGPTSNSQRMRIPFLEKTEEPVSVGEEEPQDGPG